MLLEPVDREDISEHFVNVVYHRFYVRAAYDLWGISAPESVPTEKPLRSKGKLG